MTKALLTSVERIERAIIVIRDHKVMLDRDLPRLYSVKSIALRQQVKRNLGRFPPDFMFKLTRAEAKNNCRIVHSFFVAQPPSAVI
jgi:hypothetical protein